MARSAGALFNVGTAGALSLGVVSSVCTGFRMVTQKYGYGLRKDNLFVCDLLDLLVTGVVETFLTCFFFLCVVQSPIFSIGCI